MKVILGGNFTIELGDQRITIEHSERQLYVELNICKEVGKLANSFRVMLGAFVLILKTLE